ncbi:unnamed protein product, partial [Oikopleura dioica]
SQLTDFGNRRNSHDDDEGSAECWCSRFSFKNYKSTKSKNKLLIFEKIFVIKIARLDDCTLNELTVRLNEEREAGHAALSIENGKKALICFGISGVNLKTCEIFDGSTTVSTFSADWTHYFGGIGLYKNQPTSVGCRDEEHQKAETLSATGWTSRPNHPKRISDHSLVGFKIGELLQADYVGSAIYIGRSIYYFGYSSMAIERLDFTETEELQNVAQIGNQPGGYFFPVLFQTVPDYCI